MISAIGGEPGAYCNVLDPRLGLSAAAARLRTKKCSRRCPPGGAANSLSLFDATARQLAPGEGKAKEDISELPFSLASSDRLALLSEVGERRQRQAALS